jgi:hypothetical protein
MPLQPDIIMINQADKKRLARRDPNMQMTFTCSELSLINVLYDWGGGGGDQMAA